MIPSIRLVSRRARILSGHLWAYRSDLQDLKDMAPGLADLEDERGVFLGRGYINPRSEISFRLLTKKKEPIDAGFFTRSIRAAIDLRKRHGLLDEPCRLVYSEADFLPGFIVDRYANVLVVAIGTAGAEGLKPLFLEALENLFPNDAIYEKSDSGARVLEGISPSVGIRKGNPTSPAAVKMDGIPVEIDFINGQKTGAFLDARLLRRHLRQFAKGCRVLDCFSHIGLFSLYAKAGGASSLTVIETDNRAVSAIRKSLPEATLICENAFDILRRMARDKTVFDRIVLDPPAFTKNATSAGSAARGYNEINLRALKMLPPGGLLYTSSCSYHLSREHFLQILRTAAVDAKKQVRVVESFGASPDHPVLLSVPETDYFKGFVLENCST